MFSSVRQQGHPCGHERLNFSDDAVTALPSPSPTRALAKTVLADSQRVCILECFRRGIQTVGHVGMHTAQARLSWASAHPAGHGLVIGELVSCTRIETTHS